MQTMETIEKKLIDQLANILNRPSSEIDPEAQLYTLGMDSLSFVELLVFIENEFKLQLMQTDLTNEDFRTIRSLARNISRLI
ncbi:MAG: acyl carrier protein [Thermodesulfobacteriota bacterium]